MQVVKRAERAEACACCGVKLSFPAFAACFLFHSKASRAVLVVSLLYIKQTARRLQSLTSATGPCPHLVFVCAVAIGAKFVEDGPQSYSNWAIWSGLSRRQLVKMELVMLRLLNFNVSFVQEEFDTCANQIFGMSSSPKSEAAALLCFLAALRRAMEDQGRLHVPSRKESVSGVPNLQRERIAVPPLSSLQAAKVELSPPTSNFKPRHCENNVPWIRSGRNQLVARPCGRRRAMSVGVRPTPCMTSRSEPLHINSEKLLVGPPVFMSSLANRL